MVRHFAFFRQDTGAWVRETQGHVPAPPWLVVRLRWRWLIERWATWVSQPEPGEVGLDVTHFTWALGDFAYCTLDPVTWMLQWGPMRQYLELDTATGDIVANWETMRPLRAHRPDRQILDITGTPLALHHGLIYGTFPPLTAATFLPADYLPAPLQALLIEAARASVPIRRQPRLAESA